MLSDVSHPRSIASVAGATDGRAGVHHQHAAARKAETAEVKPPRKENTLWRLYSSLGQALELDWRPRSPWAAASVASYLESIRLHDILFYGSPHPTREGLVNNIVIDHLAGLLQAGVDAGAWSIDEARFTAVFMFNGLHGVVEFASTGEKRVNQKRLTHRLERLCFRAAGLHHG